MKRKSFFIFVLTLLLQPLCTLAAQVAVVLEIFPQRFELFHRGIRQSPVEVRRLSKVYLLPTGRQRLTITSTGYQPKSIYLEVKHGMAPIRDKLEVLGGPVRLVTEIQTSHQPKSVRFTPDGRHLAVALLSGRGVEIFDVHTHEKVAELFPPQYKDERGFVETWMLPRRGELWVSQMTTGKVHVFRLSDWSYVESFPTGGVGSKVIHADPEERYAYISNWSSFDVSVIDIATRRLVRLLPIPGIPRGIALSPDASVVFVTNFSDSTVSRFLTSHGTALPELRLGYGGAMRHAVVFGGDLHLSDMGLGKVHLIDTANGRLKASVRLSRNINTIDVSSDGRYLFASARGTNNAESYLRVGPDYGRIYILERTTLRLLGNVWGRNQPTGLAVSPNSRYLAFTDFLSSNLQIYSIVPAFIP